MRRLVAALGLSGALLLLVVGLAYADGGPHRSYSVSTDACAGCHRTHTAQDAKLLKTAASDLCLSCHDGTGATADTWDGAKLSAKIGARATGGAPAGVTGALRGGGFVYARIDSGNLTTPGAALANESAPGVTLPGVAVASSHVKFSGNSLTPQNVIWGWGPLGTANSGKTLTTALTCIDCHNPHGGGTFRILRPIPKQSGGTGVTLGDPTTTHTYTTANYWLLYKDGSTEEKWTSGDMDSWCTQCHTRYLANSSEMRTDSGDAIFKYRHVSDGTNNMSNKTGAPYGTESFSAQCLQCHVAHGSNAQFNSPYPESNHIPWPGTTTARENETTLLKVNNRGTCVSCHGSSPG